MNAGLKWERTHDVYFSYFSTFKAPFSMEFLPRTNTRANNKTKADRTMHIWETPSLAKAWPTYVPNLFIIRFCLQRISWCQSSFLWLFHDFPLARDITAKVSDFSRRFHVWTEDSAVRPRSGTFLAICTQSSHIKKRTTWSEVWLYPLLPKLSKWQPRRQKWSLILAFVWRISAKIPRLCWKRVKFFTPNLYWARW